MTRPAVKFRNLSIRWKQMLIIMLTTIAALLLACAAFVAYDVQSFRRELVQNVCWPRKRVNVHVLCFDLASNLVKGLKLSFKHQRCGIIQAVYGTI